MNRIFIGMILALTAIGISNITLSAGVMAENPKVKVTWNMDFSKLAFSIDVKNESSNSLTVENYLEIESDVMPLEGGFQAWEKAYSKSIPDYPTCHWIIFILHDDFHDAPVNEGIGRIPDPLIIAPDNTSKIIGLVPKGYALTFQKGLVCVCLLVYKGQILDSIKYKKDVQDLTKWTVFNSK